ncbi:protein-serine/threonine phosphatase [Ranunculus cassubicifolius]
MRKMSNHADLPTTKENTEQDFSSNVLDQAINDENCTLSTHESLPDTKNKLCLVLDLDNTLLHSVAKDALFPKEKYLKSQPPSDSLFKSKFMITKLRPYVGKFLEEVSSMYELYVYTMSKRSYAEDMVKILDPGKRYFGTRVISRDESTRKEKKDLGLVQAPKNRVIILDDRKDVWDKDKENLIVIDRYDYFVESRPSTKQHVMSFAELKKDESETDGALARVLEVLRQVHQAFFSSEEDDNKKDVRELLKTHYHNKELLSVSK